MQYSVREPVKWDIFKLAEISERLLKESPTYAPLTFDKKKCENYLFAAMAGEISDLFMRVIVDENNEPVGGIICTIETPLYTHDKVAYDITIMLDKEHRGRCIMQVVQIVNDYRNWAAEHGAKVIKFGVSSGINVDKTDALLSRIGFERIGAMYCDKMGVQL